MKIGPNEFWDSTVHVFVLYYYKSKHSSHVFTCDFGTVVNIWLKMLIRIYNKPDKPQVFYLSDLDPIYSWKRLSTRPALKGNLVYVWGHSKCLQLNTAHMFGTSTFP